MRRKTSTGGKLLPYYLNYYLLVLKKVMPETKQQPYLQPFYYLITFFFNKFIYIYNNYIYSKIKKPNIKRFIKYRVRKVIKGNVLRLKSSVTQQQQHLQEITFFKKITFFK